MRKLTTKPLLAAGAAALAIGAGGGAAIAASKDGRPSPNAFLDSVAKHLGVSSEELKDATKAAAIDQVDAALKDGRITKQQAEAAKSRIESGDVPPFGGPGRLGGHGPFGGFRGPRGPGRHLSPAADYLGLTVEELHERLADGKSLADVAKAEDKSVDGLEDAIVIGADKELDEAVKDKRLTERHAKSILDRLKSHVDDLVNGRFEGRRGGRHGFGPPPGGPAAMGGAGAGLERS